MILAHVKCNACSAFIAVDLECPAHEQDLWKVQLPPAWFSSQSRNGDYCSWRCVLEGTKGWTLVAGEDREAFLRGVFEPGRKVNL